MSKSKSLAQRKKMIVESTLKDISDGDCTFEAGDEMMQWIDGQFEDPVTPLSKLFSKSHLDHTKPENWKWWLWVLAEVHYLEGRGQNNVVWPEQDEVKLLKDAAELREQCLINDGKRLSLASICDVLVKDEPYRTLKTGRKKGSKREPGSLTTQLKNTIKKYRLILSRPTIAEDMFGDAHDIRKYLAVLDARLNRSTQHRR
jgi:hypothetical protein